VASRTRLISFILFELCLLVFPRFDAWLLKPINVERLSLLLQGVKSPELRRDALYAPGHWENGGWFLAWAHHPKLKSHTMRRFIFAQAIHWIMLVNCGNRIIYWRCGVLRIFKAVLHYLYMGTYLPGQVSSGVARSYRVCFTWRGNMGFFAYIRRISFTT